MNEAAIRGLFDLDVHPRWRKTHERLVAPLVRESVAREREVRLPPEAEQRRKDRLAQRLASYVTAIIQRDFENLHSLRVAHADFTRRHARAHSDEERRHHILDFARRLGADTRQLEGDEAAFERWFGADAVNDRYARRHGRSERRLAFYLQRLGTLAAQVLKKDGEAAGYAVLWKRLSVEDVVLPLLRHDGDSRVSVEAFRCLSKALQSMPAESQEGQVGENTLQFIYRAGMESRQPVWIQCEALNVLQSLSLTSFQLALNKRLKDPREGDDIFVRRRAVLLLGKNLPRSPDLAALFSVVAQDPSPYVRQALPQALRLASTAQISDHLPRLSLQDTVPQVRAAALLEIPELLSNFDLFDVLIQILIDVFDQERDGFVLRVALKVASDAHLRLQAPRPLLAAAWQGSLTSALERLHTGAQSLPVRRWAAQARERIWCQGNSEASTLLVQLTDFAERLSPGRGRGLPRTLTRACDSALLGRTLAVLTQRDFCGEIERGWWRDRLTRGHIFGLRWWRVIHEFRHPSPDKRQAFRHTIGRIFYGRIRAPSAILAELAQTKVPGEPLFIASEGGWRPYLPLVDDLLSSLYSKKAVQIFSSEGITIVKPPRRVFTRIKAWAILTWRFIHYARLRNWLEDSPVSPNSYVESLHQLGFRLSMKPYAEPLHGHTRLDPAVLRFFPED